jgi:hypothetical protein
MTGLFKRVTQHDHTERMPERSLKWPAHGLLTVIALIASVDLPIDVSTLAIVAPWLQVIVRPTRPWIDFSAMRPFR